MSVDAQLEVLPGGTHLIANCDGVVLVVAHRADVAATAESPAGQALTALLGLVRQAGAGEQPRSGRMFARLATSWLMSLDNEDQVEFGVITPGTAGVALFLHGGMTAVLESSDRSEVLHGRDAGFTVDRVVIPGPDIGVGLFVDAAGVSAKTLPGRGVAGLGAGTVPGAGAVLWFGPPSARAAAARERLPQSEDTGVGVEPPAGASGGAAASREHGDAKGAARTPLESGALGAVSGSPVELRKGARGSGVGGWADEVGGSAGSARAGGSAGPDVGARAAAEAGSGGVRRRDPELDVDTFVPSVPIPVPVRTAGVVPVVEPEGGGVVVRGFRCSRQHLNDPRVSFCAVCGIRMDQMTCVLTEGVRPPLGLLMLDDGTSFVLDNDIVLGREPEHAEAVRRGARPIRLPDRSGGMSRAHVEIRLVEWDVTVVDQGSANGTYIRLPGHQEWIRSMPNHPSTLAAGAQILLGGRILTFDSQHSQF